MAERFLELHPVLQALIRVLLFVLPTLLLVPFTIWWERRLLSWMQDRFGPNRVGPFGLLQPFLDGAKLMFKEDITPGSVDRLIYFLAPGLALFPAFTLGGTIPWGPYRSLTPVADIDIGVLYIMAISSLGVYGLVLAGYSANNKYSLMGGLRASAQLISYELAMGMSLACIVTATGSLKLTSIVDAQTKGLWGYDTILANWNLLTPYGIIAAIVFFICMVAETNRAPFDLPEAENELVAGYHTEYSSFKFAAFFMGEYAAMIVWSMIFSTLFLGGYHALPLRFVEGSTGAFLNGESWLGPFYLIGKVAILLSTYIWLRATLPRLRYDQLMSLGWKSLLPMATLNLILVATWIFFTRTQNPLMGWLAWLGGAVLFVLIYRSISQLGEKPKDRKRGEGRSVVLVNDAALAPDGDSGTSVVVPAA
ncbi:MAG: NADH-quinone oxidoreductase subunit NuoH [Fimbriimonas sp.]